MSGIKISIEKTKTFDAIDQVKLYERRGYIYGSDDYLSDPQYTGKDVKILSHLHSLPKEGIWPFSYEKDYPVMIFSRKGLHVFYGYSSFIRWESLSLLEASRMLGTRGQGETCFFLKTQDCSPETEMTLRALANPHNMHLENLGQLADKLYQKGLSGPVLSGLLAFVILLITSQILYQGFKSELE